MDGWSLSCARSIKRTDAPHAARVCWPQLMSWLHAPPSSRTRVWSRSRPAARDRAGAAAPQGAGGAMTQVVPPADMWTEAADDSGCGGGLERAAPQGFLSQKGRSYDDRECA